MNRQLNSLFNNVLCDIEVGGKNRALLFKRISKKGIKLYGVKENKSGKLILSVNKKDTKKVFAICGNSWYNKLIGQKGLLAQFFVAVNRFSFILFSVLFFVALYYVDKTLLKVEISGAEIYNSDILTMLQEKGIKKYTSFDSFTIDEVENAVFSLDENFAFVSAKKQGSVLKINVVQKIEAPSVVDKTQKSIVSKYSGIIKSISVYKGKALKNVGDSVLIGETLVCADTGLENGKEYSGCLASITFLVSCEYEYTATCFSEEENQKAIAQAINNACIDFEKNEVNTQTSNIELGEIKIIKVTLNYIVQQDGG